MAANTERTVRYEFPRSYAPCIVAVSDTVNYVSVTALMRAFWLTDGQRWGWR